ncbi:MAG TPA: hypothetical protein VIR33_00110 [Thermopolyspora sp.]|jgi:hypothetical protein
MRVANEEISERSADRQTSCLAALSHALDDVGISNLLVRSIRITLAHDVPGIARHLPPELILYGAGGPHRERAKVSVAEAPPGQVFLVHHAGTGRPRLLSPVHDVEAAVWLLLGSRQGFDPVV